MQKTRVLILGATGMLGSMLLEVFDRDGSFAVHATGREDDLIEQGSVLFPRVSWHPLLLSPFESNTQRLIPLPEVDWIINAINVSRPFIGKESPTDRERALQINGIFPHELARYATSRTSKIIQVSTDWVFSGFDGSYVESDLHDALDIYGKTMSLGEVVMPHTIVLRTSLIGPEPRGAIYLLEWLLSHPQNARLPALTNHLWNGMTTLQLAQICKGIIKNDVVPFGIQHLVSALPISELDTMQALLNLYGRTDIQLEPREARALVDRTLATDRPDQNARIWSIAGYPEPLPTLNKMLEELAAFPYRFRGERGVVAGEAVGV